MSYTYVAPDPRTRPSTVSASVALLYVVAVLEAISAVLALFILSKTRGVYEEMYAHTSRAGAMRTALTIGSAIGVTVSALIAICFAVLAIFVGRGTQPARVVAWVVAGLFALCSACSVAGSAVSGTLTSQLGQNQTEPGLPTPNEVAKAVSDALPSWVGPTSTAISVLVLIALVTVIILLALPASNEYFRRPAEVWVPPAGYPSGGPMPPPSGPLGPPNP